MEMNDKKAFVPKIGDLVYITDNKSYMKGRSGVVLMQLYKNAFMVKVLENGVSHNVVVKGEGLQENPIMGSGDNVEKGATCEVFDSKGERAIDDKSVQKVTDCVASLKQTKASNINTDGQYTPKRVALHKEIISKFKKGVTCINKGKPIAVLMGGSPASGKSTFLKKYRPYLLSNNIFKIDADEVRAQLPEYKGWNASQTQDETSDIVKTLISDKNIGIPCLFDFIYDGTMTSPTRYIKLVEVLKSQGYQIFIVFMTGISKDVIKKRILNRYKESGRFVPMIVVEDFYANGENTMKSLKGMVDGYLVIDGSDYDYKILEQGGKKLPNKRLYEKLGETIKMSNGGGVDNNKMQETLIKNYSNNIEFEESQLPGLAKESMEFKRRTDNIKEYKKAIEKLYRKLKMGTGGGVGDAKKYIVAWKQGNDKWVIDGNTLLSKIEANKKQKELKKEFNSTPTSVNIYEFMNFYNNIWQGGMFPNVSKPEKVIKLHSDYSKMETGGEVGKEVYIEFLNKEKGFKKDVKHFNSYNEAVEWARKNFDKFSPDMIKRKMLKGGDTKMKTGGSFDKIKQMALLTMTPFAFKKKAQFLKENPEMFTGKVFDNGGGVGTSALQTQSDKIVKKFAGLKDELKMLNKLYVLSYIKDPGYGYDNVFMFLFKFAEKSKYEVGFGLFIYDIGKKSFIEEPSSIENYSLTVEKVNEQLPGLKILSFIKNMKTGGSVGSFKIGEFYVGKNKNIKYKFLKEAKPFGYQFDIYKWDSLNYTYKKDSTPYIFDKNELKKYGVNAQKTGVDKKTDIKFSGSKLGWKHKIK